MVGSSNTNLPQGVAQSLEEFKAAEAFELGRRYEWLRSKQKNII